MASGCLCPRVAQIAVAFINVEPDQSHLTNFQEDRSALHINGYSTLDQDHHGELANRFSSDQAALRAREESMSEGIADTAVVEVHHLIVLAAGEDNTLVEGIAALRIDEAGVM